MKTKILASLFLSAIAAHANAVPVMLNVDTNAKVFICAEKITTTDNQMSQNIVDNGVVNVVDYGNSFYVISPKADATAYSGVLTQKANGFIAGQPVKGISMFKGISDDTKGTYGYIGDSMISWDCRR